MQCIECGRAAKRGTVEHVTVVGDDRFAVPVKAWICPCGESLVEGAELERAEYEVASRLVVGGLVNKDSFRFLRTVLGWSGREAARRLGVSHESISRWETGARPLDRFVWITLASLVRDKKDGIHDTEQLLAALA